MLINFTGFCQQVYFSNPTDSLSIKTKLAILQNMQKSPASKIIIEAGKLFVGTAYKAHTLELGDSEKLIINNQELDCTTFC